MKRSVIQQKARDTGPSPLQRAQVIDRAHGYCERCGKSVHHTAYSIHHRLPRGRGGVNVLSNLMLLCGSATSPGGCHGHVESYRAEAYEDGYLVRSGMVPAEIPTLILGRGLTLLTDDGEYAEVPRP